MVRLFCYIKGNINPKNSKNNVEPISIRMQSRLAESAPQLSSLKINGNVEMHNPMIAVIENMIVFIQIS